MSGCQTISNRGLRPVARHRYPSLARSGQQQDTGFCYVLVKKKRAGLVVQLAPGLKWSRREPWAGQRQLAEQRPQHESVLPLRVLPRTTVGTEVVLVRIDGDLLGDQNLLGLSE